MALRLQKIMMVSAAALALAAALPALQPAGSSLLSSAAYARGGHDGGSGSSGRGGSDDSGGDDHGGSSHDSSGSNSGHGRGSDDSGADDNGGDRHGGRSAAAGTDDNGRRGRDNDGSDRPRVTLSVSATSLQGLLNGSLIAVDQLGRRLEVEVENEHGVQTVEVKPHRSDAIRNPGPITDVSIRPAATP
jgi:hypothetical protein